MDKQHELDVEQHCYHSLSRCKNFIKMRNYSNFIGVGVYFEKEKNYHGSSVFSCRISNSIKN